MAVDTAGNVFVADTGNHRIRKVTSDGQVSTWAGNGVAAFVDGRAAEASFHRPSALVVDPDGNLWVADTGNHAIRHVSADGQVTTWVGNGVAGGSDGTRSTVRLNAPAGIARDGQNRLYITEFGGHRVRRVEADGNVSTVAGDPAGQRGYIDGLGVEARFERPTGIAVDASGLIYVADTGNHAIRRVTPEGRVETLAGAGLADFVEGEGKAARFASPTGIAVGTNGTVWVNDTDNRRVRRILVDRSPEALPVITKQPTNLTVVVGDLARVSVEATGEGPLAYFLRWPWWWSESGVVSDQPNVEFVATGGSTPVEYQVLVGNASGWVTSSTFQVNLQQPSIPVGAPVTVTKVTEAAFAPEAIWNEPASFPRGGIALDPLGNLVVAQCAPALIRQVTPAGSVKTLAGIDEGYRDGPVSGARFRNPSDLCIDAAGNIFIADTLNQRIRRLTPEGVVSTVAGSGAAGWVDGPAVGARFDWPTGIARGPEGSLYVADFRNHALRRIPPDGRVETWAGDGTPGNVNGPRQTARLYLPYRVAVDEAGNVYFTERARFTVRRISPAGEVSVFAGDGTSGYRDGPSAQARFSQPGALAVAPDGALWIVDEDNQVIRRISPAGQVETVAGSGLTIWGKDEGFQTPNGIALVSSGIAYVMDKGSRIQRITLADPDPNHPLPGLRLVKIAGKYYVTWPEAAPGIRLQQATNLVAGDWWDVPNTDGSSSVEIRATGATGFFRLIRN